MPAKLQAVSTKTKRAASTALCGEKGIRTPETLLGFTRFPGGPVQPLLHLSLCGGKDRNFCPFPQLFLEFCYRYKKNLSKNNAAKI